VGGRARPDLGRPPNAGRRSLGGPPGDLRDRPGRGARHDQVGDPTRIPARRI